RFHEGRGQQENVFSELKTEAQMDYVPVNSWIGNQIYLLCTLMAHNLGRELQMGVGEPAARVSATRSALWVFDRLDTVRRKFIQRAGRLTRPGGVLTLTLGDEPAVREGLLQYLAA
ncbi:IS1380 family transposase, partial [Verrucomicrobiota bacterium]